MESVCASVGACGEPPAAGSFSQLGLGPYLCGQGGASHAMLTISKSPDVLGDYAVAGFDVRLAAGCIGSVVLHLNPLGAPTDRDLQVFTGLQKALGEEIHCEFGDWSFAGWLQEMTLNARTDSLRLTLSDGLFRLAETCRSRVFAGTRLGEVISGIMPAGQKCEVPSGFERHEVGLAIQYQESDLDFLRRLVHRYAGGIWCVGDTIHAGCVEVKDPEELHLDHDVTHFTLTSSVGPERIEAKTVSYKNGLAKDSTVELPGQKYGNVQDAVVGKRGKPLSDSSLHIIAEDTDDAASEFGGLKFLKSQAAGRLSVSGRLTKPIHAGTPVRIVDPEGNGESLVVTFLSGVWRCDAPSDFVFEASAPDALVLGSSMPVLGLRTSAAEVKETRDNMNRVRVSFPWDSNKSITPWLRMVSPSWGKDHMHYIPPEVGDTVLVVWGQDDLDAIVLGSLAQAHMSDEASDPFVLRLSDGRVITFGKNDIRIVNEAEEGNSRVELLPKKIVIRSDRVEIESKELQVNSGQVQLESDETGVTSGKFGLKSDKTEVDSSGVEVKTPKFDVK